MYLLGIEQVGKLLKDLRSNLYKNKFDMKYDIIDNNESINIIIDNVITVKISLKDKYFGFVLNVNDKEEEYAIFKQNVIQQIAKNDEERELFEKLFFDADLKILKSNNNFNFVSNIELSNNDLFNDDVVFKTNIILDYPIIAKILYDFVTNSDLYEYESEYANYICQLPTTEVTDMLGN